MGNSKNMNNLRFLGRFYIEYPNREDLIYLLEISIS